MNSLCDAKNPAGNDAGRILRYCSKVNHSVLLNLTILYSR